MTDFTVIWPWRGLFLSHGYYVPERSIITDICPVKPLHFAQTPRKNLPELIDFDWPRAEQLILNRAP